MLSDKLQDKVLTDEQTELVVGGNASNGKVNIPLEGDGFYFFMGKGSSSLPLDHFNGKLGN